MQLASGVHFHNLILVTTTVFSRCVIVWVVVSMTLWVVVMCGLWVKRLLNGLLLYERVLNSFHAIGWADEHDSCPPAHHQPQGTGLVCELEGILRVYVSEKESMSDQKYRAANDVHWLGSHMNFADSHKTIYWQN